tara:strand:- start:161 stop:442 length:282 start_codon:yes stop_codon:yes gene_type:complete
MTGKLKVLTLSQDIEGLKVKKNYTDVVIHFCDLHDHTITLKNDKKYTLSIQALSIEADSLLLEGDIWKEGDKEEVPAIISEFRFYPQIEKSTN